MANLKADIAAFDRMKAELEAHHRNQWVLFHDGQLIDAFPDFEAAATVAVDRFDQGPYLIRQVGAEAIPLPGGMVFRPATTRARSAASAAGITPSSTRRESTYPSFGGCSSNPSPA